MSLSIASSSSASERGEGSDAVIQACDALLASLATLSPQECREPRLQERLRSITKFRRKDLSVSSPSERMSKTAERALEVVTDSIASAVEDSKLNRTLFATFRVVHDAHAGFSALSTLVHHRSHQSTESRLLALLVTHSIEVEIESGRRLNDLTATWAEALNVKARAVLDIEAVGRFCMHILATETDEERLVVEPCALGLLALMSQHFTVLKALANHTQHVIAACKRIPGCLERAKGLASVVYAGIRKLVTEIGLTVSPHSSLGRRLAAHEMNHVALNGTQPQLVVRGCEFPVLPYSAPIFDLVSDCNFEQAAALFESGLAPVNAVDPFGLGLLYVSIS